LSPLLVKANAGAAYSRLVEKHSQIAALTYCSCLTVQYAGSMRPVVASLPGINDHPASATITSEARHQVTID